VNRSDATECSVPTRRRHPLDLFTSGFAGLVVRPVSSAYARLLLCLWGARVGRGLQVMGRIRMRLLGTLTVGDWVHIRSGYANYVGGHQPMAIWICSGGHVTIGDRCRLSNTTVVCKAEVAILPETLIGGGSRIYDTDFHQLDPLDRLWNTGPVASAPIRIGPRAFLGGHVTVLKGVTIGEGAVIGAGSIVTRDVPAFEVWAGVPARLIRVLPPPSSGRTLLQNDSASGQGV